MFKIRKTKLEKLLERRIFKSEFDIDHFLDKDENIVYFRAFHVKQGDTIYWIEGYGERSHFFLREVEKWDRRRGRTFVQYKLSR